MSSGGGGWPPSDADGFGQGGQYGGDEFGTDRDQRSYFDESGYEWSEPSGRPQGQGDPYARGRTDQYGQSRGSGRDSYGQGWQSGGHDVHDQGGYGQGSYGQAGFGAYGEPGYDRDLGSDRYARGSYGQDGYSQSGYNQDGHNQDGYGHGGGYGQGGYGGEYYGQPPASRALPAPEGFGGDGYRQDGPGTDSYGRDQYGQDSFGSTASYQGLGGYQQAGGYQQTDGYQQADGYGQDNGYFGRSSDTGSFGRPDTGSYARPDTGSYARPDTGPFGQPAASLRRTDPGGGTGTHAGGYDQWHDAAEDADGWDSDEPAGPEGDWQDDADNGLLSRRFGSSDRGSGDRGSSDRGSRVSSRGSGRRAVRAARPKRLRGKFAVTAAILAGALVLGAVADFGYERFKAWHTSRYGDYAGAGTGQVQFTVRPGAVLSSLGPALVQAGIIEEVRPFDSAAAAAANASHLQPGVYLLHHHMNSALAVQWLLNPAHRVKDQVTIIEGTRASAIAQALAKQTGLPASQFTQIIEHPPASLGLPTWSRGKTAEGFLFPDTYTLLPKMTALQILQMMVTEFKQKVAAIDLAGAAQKVFTTPWHALIVASMIQAEAGSPGDFGKISRVVWNRLRINQLLEFDSTVFYAMGKYGTAVNAQQKNFPSPYNTYLHAGLPPGPIGNPGVLAMQAAVHATKGQWLYFITDTRHKPYKTYFYDTLAELQAAQQKFQN